MYNGSAFFIPWKISLNPHFSKGREICNDFYQVRNKLLPLAKRD
jgi:hypothetical protein